MNYEYEKGIKALELCLNMHSIKDEELAYVGLTREDITQIKNGNKYMTEEQLYNFAFIIRSPNMIDRPLIDWLNCGGLWGLTGIIEPTFSLNETPIRAIMDLPYIFINNPNVYISINDTIIHSYPNSKDGYIKTSRLYTPTLSHSERCTHD